MTAKRKWTGPIVALALVALTITVWAWAMVRARQPAPGRSWLPALPRVAAPGISYEEWARSEFHRKHSGEKPLNWKIAGKARGFYLAKPMGRFVLHKNDCSDFTDALIDDALGAKARFRRRSTQHLLSHDPRVWDLFYWDGKAPLLPGDELSVAHSPHYSPHEGSIRHCGILGADQRVYDWTKLIRWRGPRYGRHTVDWFTRNSPPPAGVIIRRLKPQYRYLIEPLPKY